MKTMTTRPLPDCAHPGCGHPADWHRHDDSDNVTATDPSIKFRCIGHDCERDFSGREPCPVACPDYTMGAS